MIEITVNSLNEWQVVYRLEGLRCTTVLTQSLEVALEEVKQKMWLEMGLAKGKHFTSIGS